MVSPLSKVSFLVVEDNANMAQIVRTILKNFGAVHIYEARDVAQAFHLVREFAIDIVFLDYNLGFMDGIEFTRMIRTSPDSPNPYVPIIMLTGHTGQQRVNAARDAGVTEFCSKPVTAAQLHRKIVAVIDHPRDFVRSEAYFGPNRRRHGRAVYTDAERRAAIAAQKAGANSDKH